MSAPQIEPTRRSCQARDDGSRVDILRRFEAGGDSALKGPVHSTQKVRPHPGIKAQRRSFCTGRAECPARRSAWAGKCALASIWIAVGEASPSQTLSRCHVAPPALVSSPGPEHRRGSVHVGQAGELGYGGPGDSLVSGAPASRGAAATRRQEDGAPFIAFVDDGAQIVGAGGGRRLSNRNNGDQEGGPT